ncbi:phage/plasmid primase, P4 family [Corticicoccus populi]|uniref:Phage/plasmid primase, P4 family n=1 Tax=Corticicoccus populi TaxID=1812821 RepID=A0ABW5WWG5_9STAP
MTVTTNKVSPVDFENIPDELKEINAWVLWKLEPVPDKETGEIKYYTKVPIQPTSKNASVSNPSTWSTFSSVERAYNNNVGDGIGLVLNESHDVFVLDIDDTSEHEYHDQFKQGTYCEYSPSGNGIHVYFKGKKPKTHSKHNQAKDLELFSKIGFVTVTGHQTNDIDYVAEMDSHIDNLIEKEFKEDVPTHEESDITERSPSLSDDEIITLFRKAKNSDKFSQLFDEGDTSNYNGNESGADQALANIIAFYTQDPAQIERIMRMSALVRDKWDRKEKYPYIQRTIDEAIGSLKEVYKGSSASEYNFEILNGDKPQTMSELRRSLIQRRSLEIEKLIEQWELEGKNGYKPYKLTPSHCAMFLPEYVHFALFDMEENTRLAMYLPEDGVYTRNRTLINRVVSWIEPTLSENQTHTVIFYLTNRAEVIEPTNSKYLIPVNNGVFNLKTKELEPFTPDYVFTSKISTNYIEKPENPLIDGWDVEQFLNSIACGNSGVIKLLWQVISDSLNGNYTRKKAIFLVGEGNNGKGSYQDLITHLIGGSNIANLKMNQFEKRFMLGGLEGKTAVIGDDNPNDVYLEDSSNFNSIVTGDRVLVELKNKQPYSARFHTTIIQSTNGMPRFRNQTNGTYRRLIIVPFKANFNGSVENTKIKEEYIKDKRVLEYVLYKAINMEFDRFHEPHASIVAIREFKKDNDPIYEFKEQEFDMWNLDAIPKNVVYKMYMFFCENNGYKSISVRKFHNGLKRHLNSNWDTTSTKRFTADEINRFKDLNHTGYEKIYYELPEENETTRVYSKNLL